MPPESETKFIIKAEILFMVEYITLNELRLRLYVPAWPRYRVLRVQELGQYNLEILSADLSDDSLYECQAPDAALRSRRAKLTVLSTFVRQWTCG